jgi:hypothetical protein
MLEVNIVRHTVPDDLRKYVLLLLRALQLLMPKSLASWASWEAKPNCVNAGIVVSFLRASQGLPKG